MSQLYLPYYAQHLIHEFSRPLTRPDWRTCKREEAEMVEELNEDFMDYLEKTKERWCWIREEMREIDDWSLYGKRWLMYAHHDEYIAHRRAPLRPPREGMYSDPKDWYSHRTLWLNG